MATNDTSYISFFCLHKTWNGLDFNSDDEKLIRTLDAMYPSQLVENSTVVCLDKKYFVFTKSDAQHLTEEHFDILLTLAENEELHNPVFVDIDDEGRLIVD